MDRSQTWLAGIRSTESDARWGPPSLGHGPAAEQQMPLTSSLLGRCCCAHSRIHVQFSSTCSKGTGTTVGTSQELTREPSFLIKHGYHSHTSASSANRLQPSGFPPATFPVGSAGSRITGLAFLSCLCRYLETSWC